MTALPVRHAHEIALVAPEQRWLIEGLWGAEAVGIIGGEPQCCKSFLALDLAVAVASATPCPRRFPGASRGRVLLFAAEDALPIVRQRLDGICAAASVALEDLDLQVITAPTLRLDVETDRNRLDDTVRVLRPALVVLDPFVRLHRIDENGSAEVAPLLDFLRSLQRRYQTAIVLVHHTRKGAAHLRAGQALRGSSELHAWGESNLYLRRPGVGDRLTLTIEHRAAASSEGLVASGVRRGRRRRSAPPRRCTCPRVGTPAAMRPFIYTGPVPTTQPLVTPRTAISAPAQPPVTVRPPMSAPPAAVFCRGTASPALSCWRRYIRTAL